jgi:hypothetical protein
MEPSTTSKKAIYSSKKIGATMKLICLIYMKKHYVVQKPPTQMWIHLQAK